VSAPADLTRLMNNARVRLPGATDDMLKVELFNVLDEFFQNSKAWKEDITVRGKANKYEYELVPSEPGVIESLIGVADADERPVRAAMPMLGTLNLQTAPSQDQDYVATVSLTVVDPVKTDGYPQFPAWLLQKYGAHILDGLLGRMMSQIAKPYSSQQMAVYHLKRFRNGMAQARAESKHQNLYAGQTWRFPRIAPGRQR